MHQAFLPLRELVDPVKETKRLTKQATKMEKDVMGLEKRLNSSGFLGKASAEVVEETQQTLADKKLQLATIQKSLDQLIQKSLDQLKQLA